MVPLAGGSRLAVATERLMLISGFVEKKSLS